MGALKNVLKSAMTRKHVPEGCDTAIATQSMGTSVKALAIVAKGNRAGSQAMVLAANTIGKTRNTQAATGEVAKRLGQVRGWADQQQMLNSAIKAGAADYLRGSKAQADSAKVLAKTSQEVAVLNSAAQYDMYKGHHAAGVQVAINQSAYGGAGWSA